MKPPGSIVRLYWDSINVAEPGDVIQTRTGRRYEVQHNRIQERGKHTGRQHMTCRVMSPEEPTDPDVRLYEIWWYKR